MKSHFAALLCVFALGCMSIGCGATSQANSSFPASPTNPTNPSSPANDPAAASQVATTQLPDGSTNSPYATQLAASGGIAPYIWSVSGPLPPGLMMSSSGTIAGSPTAAGQSMLAVNVTDSEQQPQTAQVTLPLNVASGVRASSNTVSVTSQFYGTGRGGDSLANCQVGPNGFVISYRFVAQHAGSISKVRFYIIPDKAGYAGGNAGKLQVSIESDDGTSAHNPSGRALATAVIQNPLAATGSARYFPLVTFPSPANISAGAIYHVVFTNVDSSPTVNFLSVDEMYYKTATTPDQPTVSDMASAVLRKSSTGWRTVAGYSPIFQLYYSNGDYQGYGYVEAFVMAPQVISGSKQIRETFKVTGTTRNVSKVGVRLARISGSGNLTMRIENSAGTLIEQGYVSASSFPTAGSHVWVNYNLASSTSLVVGQTYHLVLEAPSSTVYEAFSIQKGTAYWFDKLTYFPDGYAQFNPGTGWVGWSVWGATNRTDSDLQFYFGLAQ